MKTNLTDEAVMIELNRIKTDTYPTTDFDRRDAALERAKQAVRKQIPRKVKKTMGFYECPVCESFFADDSRKYCYHCGQALRWG